MRISVHKHAIETARIQDSLRPKSFGLGIAKVCDPCPPIGQTDHFWRKIIKCSTSSYKPCFQIIHVDKMIDI